MGFDFDQALDLMKRKTISDPIDWRNSWDKANREAFWIAGITSKELLIFLHESICEAMDKGESYEAWCKRILPKLEGKLNPNRLRTIFTTNVFTAQSAARYMQLKHFADEETYWQYVTVDDDRVRPAHQQLHNKVFHCEDVFWDTHYPPNGFNCRCVVVSLDGDEVKKRGLKIETGEGRIKWITDPKGNKRAVYTAPDGTECPTDIGWGYNPGRLDKLEDIDREKQLELDEASDKSGEAVRRESAVEPERPAVEPVKPEAEPTGPAISAPEPKKPAEPEQEKPADKTEKPKKTDEEESRKKRRGDRFTTRKRDSRDQDGKIYSLDSDEPERVKPKRSSRKRVSLDKDEQPAAPKPLKTVPKSEPVPGVPAPIKPAPVSPAPAPAPPKPVPVQPEPVPVPPEPVPVPSVPQPKPIPAPSVPAEEPDDATVSKRKKKPFNPLRLTPLLLDKDKPAEVVPVEEDEDELPNAVKVNSLDKDKTPLSEQDKQPIDINSCLLITGFLDIKAFKAAIRNKKIEHAAITDKNGRLLVYVSGTNNEANFSTEIIKFLQKRGYDGELTRKPTLVEKLRRVPEPILSDYAIQSFANYSKGGNVIHNHTDISPQSDDDINSIKLLEANTISAVNSENEYILDFSDTQNRKMVYQELIKQINQIQEDYFDKKKHISEDDKKGLEDIINERNSNLRKCYTELSKKYNFIFRIVDREGD